MQYLLFIISVALACPGSDKRCAACVENNCRACYDGFVNYQGKCAEVLTKIPDCVSYMDQSSCKFCRNGQFIDSYGKCQKIQIKNCIELDDQDKSRCKVCSAGIKESNGACPIESKCTLPNCSVCSNRQGVEQCNKCLSGFALFLQDNKFSCVQTSDVTNNCELISKDQKSCQVCDVNFYYSNGKCLAQDLYRIDMNSSEQRKGVNRLGVVAAIMILMA